MGSRQQRIRDKAQQAFLSSTVRGTLLFSTGLGLTIREAFIKGPERPSLYVLYAGMMGLPFIWGGGNKNEPGPKS